MKKVDAKTGMIVEEGNMEWDEMTHKSFVLLPTVSSWYQTWLKIATGTMLEKNEEMRTALAEKEAKIERMKKLATEDGDYYHQFQVRLSNLEEEKRIWDLERKRKEEDMAACMFKFQPAATQTETAVGHDKCGKTGVPQVQEGETQPPARAYASVAAQTEVQEKEMAKHTDSIDKDSTAPPSEVTADPPSTEDRNKDICKWGWRLLKSCLCFLTSKKHKQDYKQRGTTTCR